MADRNRHNPDQSPLSRSSIQHSHEELLRSFQNLSTSEIGTVQNGSPSTGFLSNSIVFGSGIGTSSVLLPNPRTEITGFEEQRLGLLGSSEIPVLQSPLELQRYYPQQNMSMPTMGPSFIHENTFFNDALPTDHLNLGFHGSSYGNFVRDFPNLHLDVPENPYGFYNPYLNPYVDQISSLDNSSMTGSTTNYCSSEQISEFNEDEILDIRPSQKFQKMLNGDLTLLDELRPDELLLMATDKLGSEYLLEILSTGDQLSTAKIIRGISDYVVPLMSDPFGNRIFQKVLVLSFPSQIMKIADTIIAEKYGLIKAASDRFGIYSIQKLIKALKKSNKIGCVMSILQPRLFRLMMNKTGSHLIQFLLQSLNYEQNQSIYEVAVYYCLILATDRQGCFTLKVVMDTIRDPLRGELLKMIWNNAVFLSLDPYGNYVIQHVLEIDDFTITDYLCKMLQGNYVSLSKHKYGSHVVEKCISTKNGLDYAVVEFLSGSKLIELAKDPSGNYVIQKVLEVTKRMRGNLYVMLVGILQQHSDDIENHPHGSNVYKLIKAWY